MKRPFITVPYLLLTMTALSGCTRTVESSFDLTMIYGAMSVLSLFLLLGCCKILQDNKHWFLILFSSVLIINIGYTLLSASNSLEMALNANRLSYLGSVFLPLSMLMTILNVTKVKYNRHLPKMLFVLSVVVFLIAASPGILPIYYKEVSFEVINGTATLVKVYGPLHPLYMLYLFGYFAAMVTVIIRASVKKTIESASHAIVLAIAVLVNIGVWFTEQLCDIEFEFLSISYIISELFLLGVHLVVKENQRLREKIRQVETVQNFTQIKTDGNTETVSAQAPLKVIDTSTIEIFVKGVDSLTATEKAIFDSYVARKTTKEIMAEMNIKENTLKFHNKNIYGKLGVSSRKELLEIYRQIIAVKEKLSSTEK